MENDNHESQGCGGPLDKGELFTSLLLKNQRRIFLYILSLVPNFSDADDVMQETAGLMWRKFEEYRFGTNFCAWAQTIARYKVMSFRRSKSRESNFLSEKILAEIDLSYKHQDASLEDNMEMLKQCRRKLPENDRELLRERFDNESSAEQIAKDLGKSTRTIQRNLNRIYGLLYRCVRRTLHATKNISASNYLSISGNQDSHVFYDPKLLDAIVALLEANEDAAQREYLQQQLSGNEVAREFYLDCLIIMVGLREYMDISDNDQGESALGYGVTLEDISLAAAEIPRDSSRPKLKAAIITEDSFIGKILALVLEFSNSAGNVLIEKYSSIQICVKRAMYSLALVAMLVLLYFGSTDYFRSVSQRPVATLGRTLNATFSNETMLLDQGDYLRKETLSLKQGYAEILMNSGVKVTLQGPVEIKFDGSNQITLASGNLCAVVPEHARGFTVMCGDVKIVDYGTEFGAAVNSDGSTDAHVFDGEVYLSVRADSSKKYKHCRLVEGVGGSVDDKGRVTTYDISKCVTRFTRKIPNKPTGANPGESLNLADMIGGGNGLGTGHYNWSINLDTGQINPQRYIGPLSKHTAGLKKSVDQSAFIDCVLVPDGSDGPVEISLSGMQWSNCPSTSGFSWGDPTAGGKMLHDVGEEHRIVLNGKDYSSPEHQAIFMHSNLAVTFDLSQIRRTVAGAKLDRFTALCGVSSTVTDHKLYLDDPTKIPVVDFVVLIDGEVAFVSNGMKVGSKPSSIDIQIPSKSTYITLVVLDSDKNHFYDWGIFAQPILHLK